MPLLEAASTFDPTWARGGGDIAIVDETAARLGDDVAHEAVHGEDARDGG